MIEGFEDRPAEALYREAEEIMAEAKALSPPVWVLPSGQMVRVLNDRLERYDDILGWMDVCGVQRGATDG